MRITCPKERERERERERKKIHQIPYLSNFSGKSGRCEMRVTPCSAVQMATTIGSLPGLVYGNTTDKLSLHTWSKLYITSHLLLCTILCRSVPLAFKFVVSNYFLPQDIGSSVTIGLSFHITQVFRSHFYCLQALH